LAVEAAKKKAEDAKAAARLKARAEIKAVSLA
jgi:hypothetical protein